jgi:hypothetical protein
VLCVCDHIFSSFGINFEQRQDHDVMHLDHEKVSAGCGKKTQKASYIELPSHITRNDDSDPEPKIFIPL